MTAMGVESLLLETDFVGGHAAMMRPAASRRNDPQANARGASGITPRVKRQDIAVVTGYTSPMPEPELKNEMEALVRAIATALEMPPAEVVAALERNQATIDMVTDPEGRRLLSVAIGGRSALIGAGPPEDEA